MFIYAVLISLKPCDSRVGAGEYDIHSNEESEQNFSVERITAHPGWSGDLGNRYDATCLRLLHIAMI